MRMRGENTELSCNEYSYILHAIYNYILPSQTDFSTLQSVPFDILRHTRN